MNRLPPNDKNSWFETKTLINLSDSLDIIHHNLLSELTTNTDKKIIARYVSGVQKTIVQSVWFIDNEQFWRSLGMTINQIIRKYEFSQIVYQDLELLPSPLSKGVIDLLSMYYEPRVPLHEYEKWVYETISNLDKVFKQN